MMQARKRKDYDGEFVLVERRLAGGTVTEKREWVPNVISNNHISRRAVVVASNIDQKKFNWTRLHLHKGGLLGKLTLQTYGTNNLWSMMKFNFYVTTNVDELKEIDLAKYQDQTIVYTTATNCLTLPHNFYLIPLCPMIDQSALPVYLAAFDDHQEIFMLGFGLDNSHSGKHFTHDIEKVMLTYNATNFVLVGMENNFAENWRRLDNVRTMTYRQFVTYCDI